MTNYTIELRELPEGWICEIKGQGVSAAAKDRETAVTAAVNAWLGIERCGRCSGTGWIDDETGQGATTATASASGCPRCHRPGETGGRGYTADPDA